MFLYDIIVSEEHEEKQIDLNFFNLAIVIQCQQKILEKPNEEFKGSAQLARSIYILGVLCKYFDVEKNEFDDLEVNRLKNCLIRR